MNKRKRKKNISELLTTKVSLLRIAIAFLVVVALSGLLLFIWARYTSENSADYYAAQKRCNSKNLAIGFNSIGGQGKYYYSTSDTQSQHTVVGGVYFCTDTDAEAAGYVQSRF